MSKNLKIHNTAIIESGAKIGDNTEIGPYCCINSNVKIGNNSKIYSHVVIDGITDMGNNNHIFPFAAVGLIPQDKKFKGEKSKLVIGNNNIIREYVTIHPGTEGGGLITTIGNDCLFMVGAHIAHDCIVGNNVILANNVAVAGHVIIEDYVIIGGLSAVHQFVRIGTHAIVGGMSGIDSDIIPFGSAMGERANLAGLNIVGLKRRGFEREDIHALRSAYRLLFSSEGTLAERIEDVAERFKDNKAVMEIVEFIKKDSSRSVCLPRNGKAAA